MSAIITAVISVTSIGLISAVVLGIAFKFMYVRVDERIELIQDCLPGVNCGACGYPGCQGYATALVSDKKTKNNLCTPGGKSAMVRISELLGVETEAVERMTAIVHCRGDCNTQQKKMDYQGIHSCAAAKLLFGGEGACAFGCLGYGDWKKICPRNAICVENGLARINSKLCIGCGLCVRMCPGSLITIEKSGAAVLVLCQSNEKGSLVRKKCTKGCIGCGKCVRGCLSDAIVIEDNLAVIDHEKCSLCGGCSEVCVTGSILRTGTGRFEIPEAN